MAGPTTQKLPAFSIRGTMPGVQFRELHQPGRRHESGEAFARPALTRCLYVDKIFRGLDYSTDNLKYWVQLNMHTYIVRLLLEVLVNQSPT